MEHLRWPLAAVMAGVAAYLFNKRQNGEGFILLGCAISMMGKLHVAWLIIGIVVILLGIAVRQRRAQDQRGA